MMAGDYDAEGLLKRNLQNESNAAKVSLVLVCVCVLVWECVRRILFAVVFARWIKCRVRGVMTSLSSFLPRAYNLFTATLCRVGSRIFSIPDHAHGWVQRYVISIFSYTRRYSCAVDGWLCVFMCFIYLFL